MKKILLCFIVAFMCLTSAALGYYGGSNMSYYYPSFRSYISFNPSYEEAQRYVEDAKRYIKACDSDIELIQTERNRAVREANNVINSYNMSR